MKKLLTKEEFEKNIKPSDDMTYSQIKEKIFSKYPPIKLKDSLNDLLDWKIRTINTNLT
jgi:hypothetical protein